MALTSLFGASVKRMEDPQLITGRGKYVDDITLPNMLHMTILRSPYAHARIKRIDVSQALKQAGVVKVITGEEIRKECNLLQLGWDASALGSKVPARYPLAVEKTRYVGDPVAAVIASDKYAAVDATDLVSVDYEPRPVIVDPEKAMEKDAPLVHDELGSNVSWYWKLAKWPSMCPWTTAETLSTP